MRPRIVIPARFAASTSALRYEAIVTARALSAAVWRAGGEPLTIHPHAPDGVVDEDEVRERLAVADGLLLPGGGDLSAETYGEELSSERVYDVDVEQDAFDLALARLALADGLPLLAVCRGVQVVNVVRGGTLVQHMDVPSDGTTECHRHVVHEVPTEPGTVLAAVVGPRVVVSCYHHQCVRALGDGLVVSARAADGTPEAVELPGTPGWFLGVQWHPEDTAATDPAQHALFAGLVEAACVRSRAAGSPTPA